MDPEDMGVTGNAQLLLGMVAGSLAKVGYHELVSVDAAAGTQVVRTIGTDNLFRISVVQTEGVE